MDRRTFFGAAAAPLVALRPGHVPIADLPRAEPRAGGAGEITVTVELDERKLAEVVARELPRLVRTRGLT